MESLSFSGEEEKEKEEIDASIVQNLTFHFLWLCSDFGNSIVRLFWALQQDGC